MTTSHTPGPWINRTVGDPTEQARGMQVYAGKMHLVTCHYGDVNPREASANARLIAAAPDLLAALQSIAGWADRRMEDGSENTDKRLTWRNLEQARAAILKATS